MAKWDFAHNKEKSRKIYIQDGHVVSWIIGHDSCEQSIKLNWQDSTFWCTGFVAKSDKKSKGQAAVFLVIFNGKCAILERKMAQKRNAGFDRLRFPAENWKWWRRQYLFIRFCFFLAAVAPFCCAARRKSRWSIRCAPFVLIYRWTEKRRWHRDERIYIGRAQKMKQKTSEMRLSSISLSAADLTSTSTVFIS